MRQLQKWQLRLRRGYVFAILWLYFLASASTAPAAVVKQTRTLSKATTSRAARDDAIRGIPFRSLSPQAQRRIAAVVTKPTMFRRMPITAIQCDPELHRFAIRHPEVIVNVWQLMGITHVTASRTGPYMLRCSDGVGTATNMELIYGNRDTHVLFCEGAYDGPLFRKPVTGRCVLVLKSRAANVGKGYHVTNMMDVFLQVDHAGIDIFAKTLHPLLGKSADVNFTESMRFLERMSIAAENNAEGMQHMVGRLQDLQPAVRDQFQRVIANVNQRHETLANREAASHGTHARSGQGLSPRSAAKQRTVSLRVH